MLTSHTLGAWGPCPQEITTPVPSTDSTQAHKGDKISYCTPFGSVGVQKIFTFAVIVHIYIRVFNISNTMNTTTSATTIFGLYSPEKWLHNRICYPSNRSKQIQETHTAYIAPVHHIRGKVEWKTTCMASQATNYCVWSHVCSFSFKLCRVYCVPAL